MSWTHLQQVLQGRFLLTTSYQKVGRSSQVPPVDVDLRTSKKNYLTEKFQQGEWLGRKNDSASVVRSMISAVDSQGKRMFSSEEFLAASQVTGFFSRQRILSLTMMNLKRRLNVPPTQEATIEELIDE